MPFYDIERAPNAIEESDMPTDFAGMLNSSVEYPFSESAR